MRILKFSGLLLLFSSLAFAKPLTFTEAKKMVLENNSVIKAYEEEAKAAKYQLYQAKGAYLPKLNISETYMRTDEPATAAFIKMAQGKFDMPYFLTQMSNPENVSNFESKIEIIQPIFMNGKIFFGIKQAKEMEQAANLKLSRVKETLIYNTYRSFYAVGLSEKALDVTKKSYERTKRYYEMAKDFYENGMIVKSDLLVAENYLLMNEAAVRDAEKQVEVSKSFLQRLLNSDEDIEIVWSDVDLNVNKKLDEYLVLAMSNREDLKAYEKYLKINDYEVKKAKSLFLPEVALFANYKQNDDKFLGDEGNGFTVGAYVKLNLFNGFSDYNKVRESRSKYLSLLNKITDLKYQIKSEVKEAYYSILASEKKVETAKIQVEKAYEALKITENRFKEGLAKVTELLDREVEVKEAELKLYMAEYDLIVDKARLMLAAGLLK
ncbi:TolC family protein [Deferribacter autotrophicus]|uniref:TolC family protein n=1 Tax=Deferribacter autotrophicus TaxID=500465 RepID=A0A5A8F5E9_9BACT|nr:TolC family protein [Deferribacter autotrophicus]KAA0258614.1 TolC family protein [Deferribacter autotrophicus]